MYRASDFLAAPSIDELARRGEEPDLLEGQAIGPPRTERSIFLGAALNKRSILQLSFLVYVFFHPGMLRCKFIAQLIVCGKVDFITADESTPRRNRPELSAWNVLSAELSGAKLRRRLLRMSAA